MPRFSIPNLGIRVCTKMWVKGQRWGWLWGSALLLGAAPAWGVEQVRVEWGPLHKTMSLADVEQAAITGEVPESLGLYRPLMTAMVQETLQKPLSLDTTISDRFLMDLSASSNGQQLLTLLAAVAPEVSPESLRAAMQMAATEAETFNILSILAALPGDTLTIRGPKLLSLLMMVGLSHLEQIALSGVLNRAFLEGAPPVPSDFDPAAEGSHAINHWTLLMRDRDRDRAIPVDIYWSRRTRGPLVVISHGFGADRYFLAYLARHLASHGLTVVAIEHSGSNVESLFQATGAILPPQEFIDRPLDVSLVLDRLADLNQGSFPLRGRFNLDDVALVGHSLGGYTGLVLAGATFDLATLESVCQRLGSQSLAPADWLQCAALDIETPIPPLKDDRITQLVIMNPIIGDLFGSKGLQAVTVPTLMLTGTQDSVTPTSSQQLRPFDQLGGPRALIAVIGGTHLSVGDPDNINPALTQIPFMPELPSTETVPLRHYLQGTLLSFVMQQSPGGGRYRDFLSATYAQQFSTEALPLRYSNHLPQPVSRWLVAQDTFNRYLTPTWERLASLAHLELIGLHQQVSGLRRRGIVQSSAPAEPAVSLRDSAPIGEYAATYGPNSEAVKFRAIPTPE